VTPAPILLLPPSSVAVGGKYAQEISVVDLRGAY